MTDPISAVVRQSPTILRSSGLGPIGRWKQLTTLNCGRKASVGRGGEFSLDEWKFEAARLVDVARQLQCRQ